jgi:nitrate reductase NapE component
MKTLWRLCAVAVCLVGGVGIAVWVFSVIVRFA